MSGSTRGPFVASLESLRGVAALLVAFFHVPFTNPTYTWPVVRNGYLLVDLFFVLSGWVMAQAYGGRLRTRADVKEYLWLRLGRIYPLHLVLLLVFVAIEAARAVAALRGQELATPAFSTNSPWALFCNLFLVHAHGLTSALTFNGPSWSIGAEFWAYVSFAGLSLLPSSPRARLAIAGVGASVLFAALAILHPTNIDLTFDGGVLRCLAGFSLGLVVHASTGWLAERRWGDAVAVVGLLALVVLLHSSANGSLDYAFPFAAAALIGGIASAPNGRLSAVLSGRAVVWLGKVSFSLYMVHTAALRGVTPVVKRLGHGAVNANGLVEVSPVWGSIGLVLYLVTLLALSALSYRFIEDPARRWAKTKARMWWPR